jgi:hypothetical protein
MTNEMGEFPKNMLTTHTRGQQKLCTIITKSIYTNKHLQASLNRSEQTPAIVILLQRRDVT